jgi:hypothetical protein
MKTYIYPISKHKKEDDFGNTVHIECNYIRDAHNFHGAYSIKVHQYIKFENYIKIVTVHRLPKIIRATKWGVITEEEIQFLPDSINYLLNNLNSFIQHNKTNIDIAIDTIMANPHPTISACNKIIVK